MMLQTHLFTQAGKRRIRQKCKTGGDGRRWKRPFFSGDSATCDTYTLDAAHRSSRRNSTRRLKRSKADSLDLETYVRWGGSGGALVFLWAPGPAPGNLSEGISVQISLLSSEEEKNGTTRGEKTSKIRIDRDGAGVCADLDLAAHNSRRLSFVLLQLKLLLQINYDNKFNYYKPTDTATLTKAPRSRRSLC